MATLCLHVKPSPFPRAFPFEENGSADSSRIYRRISPQNTPNRLSSCRKLPSCKPLLVVSGPSLRLFTAFATPCVFGSQLVGRTDGRVVAWGSGLCGGDCSAVQAQLYQAPSSAVCGTRSGRAEEARGRFWPLRTSVSRFFGVSVGPSGQMFGQIVGERRSWQ